MDIRILLGTINSDKKLIPLFVCALVLVQLVTVLPTAYKPDPEPDYQYFIMPYVEQCNLFEYPHRQGYSTAEGGIPVYIHGYYTPTRDPLKWWMNCLSYQTTGSAKLIPVFFNIGIIPLTYLLAVSLTRNRMLGLIAVSALVYNPIYTRFEGSGTYDQIWAFFLLLSAYCITRVRDKIAFSVPSFFVSLAAKAIGILYIPSWIYMIFKSDRTVKSKWINILGLIGGLVAIGMIVHPSFLLGGDFKFHPENAELAISQNIKMLWEILPILIIAVGINRLMSPKNKVSGKGTVGIWMLNGFMITPIIYLFTNQLAFVYRFTPFLVFMSIYLGMIIVETGNKLLERKLSYKNKLV